MSRLSECMVTTWLSHEGGIGWIGYSTTLRLLGQLFVILLDQLAIAAGEAFAKGL